MSSRLQHVFGLSNRGSIPVVDLALKGRFAQLLEQNATRSTHFLNLPCVRSRYFVARLSKYDFWIPGEILDRHG